MSKKLKNGRKHSKPNVPGYNFVKEVNGFYEYKLKSNGLTVLYHELPGTGVVTTNITYLVGARDEARGATGVAHMLEHMLFKPTREDLKQKIDSGAMQFEREIGCVLNANTWKDRTTYYFSYPKEFVARALHIESERMDGVVISDTEFMPERNNVLSEFDMYNGEPEFSLSVAVVGTAFHSHPYGHETIGYREDIEAYTPEKLETIYRQYYRPDNAVLMVFGDISQKNALTLIKQEFGHKTNPNTPIVRHNIREPKQEGLRRVEVVRDSAVNIVFLGVKHDPFPGDAWQTTAMLFEVLTAGPESILHRQLVDTGKATRVEAMLEPTSERNLGGLQITLAPGMRHTEIEALVRKIISDLTEKDIARLLKKAVEGAKTDLFFARGSSLITAKEMTEYAAAGEWAEFLRAEERLRAVTPKAVISAALALFVDSNLTIGYFVGTQK